MARNGRDNLNMQLQNHWDEVYFRVNINELGWYEAKPTPSLDLISETPIDRNSSILDVGSGASTLIRHLIDEGFKNITAQDISEVALKKSSLLLSSAENEYVNWIIDDISAPKELSKYGEIDLWHDRTVLHFLTEKKQQIGYLKTIKSLVNPGGYVIIAVFSLDGAKKCSGLDVKNYNEKMLGEFLGDEFSLIKSFNYTYIQPSGGERPFVYTLFKRKE